MMYQSPVYPSGIDLTLLASSLMTHACWFTMYKTNFMLGKQQCSLHMVNTCLYSVHGRYFMVIHHFCQDLRHRCLSPRSCCCCFQAGEWTAPATSPCVESSCAKAPVVSNAAALQVCQRTKSRILTTQSTGIY